MIVGSAATPAPAIAASRIASCEPSRRGGSTGTSTSSSPFCNCRPPGQGSARPIIGTVSRSSGRAICDRPGRSGCATSSARPWLSRRATCVLSSSGPSRTQPSNPSSSRSGARSRQWISSVTSGCRRRKSAAILPIIRLPSTCGTASRRWPLGCPPDSPSTRRISSAASSSRSVRLARTSPSRVGRRWRVERSISRTPNCASRSAKRLESVDFGTRSARAAAANDPSRRTERKARRAERSRSLSIYLHIASIYCQLVQKSGWMQERRQEMRE